MQALEVDRGGDHLGLAARLEQAPGRPGQVAPAGVGADHRIGIPAEPLAELQGDLVAQRLDAQDAVGGVERGVEVARLLQGAQERVEELRAHRELDDLGPQGLALAGLLDDLGLARPARIEALLDHDAAQPRHGAAGGHGRPVVAAGGGHHPGIALAAGVVDRGGGATDLEAARRVGGLVLDEDPGSLAWAAQLSSQFGQVAQFQERGVADREAPLDLDHVLKGVAGGREHPLVVEGNGAALELREVHADGGLHDLGLAGEHGLVAVRIHRQILRRASGARCRRWSGSPARNRRRSGCRWGSPQAGCLGPRVRCG